MIVKHSTKADECAAFAAFVASPDFEQLPERVKKNAIGRGRGLKGERSTAHILDRHFHDAPNHVLLHDLRIPDGIGGFAQIDHVILSRLSRTASVVETKNYAGTISKNDHDEWIVWYNGQKRPQDIPNPMSQAERQAEVLKAWLKAQRHDLAFEKVRAFVIIPPQGSINRAKVKADVAIYKADNFIAAWSEFGGVTAFGRLFSSRISAKSMMAIGEQLAGCHQPNPRTFEELIGVPARKNGSPSTAAIVIENGPAAAKLEPDTPAGAESSSVPTSTEDPGPACTAPEVLVAAKAPVDVGACNHSASCSQTARISAQIG